MTVAGAQERVQTYDVTSADGTRVVAWRNGGDADALPVVVSNGLGTPPEAWPTLMRDTRRFRAVGWYYRGTAGGDRPHDRTHVRIQDHVEDLVAVMDHEGMDRAVLACWSLGVNVGFEAARRHPDRVAGLMAVAGVPGGTFRSMGAPLGVPRRVRQTLGTTTARAMRGAAPALHLVARTLPLNPVTAWAIAHTGIVLPAATPARLLPTLREFVRHDFRWYMTLALGAADHARMDLSFVHVPTTIVAGRWDVLASWKDMVEAAAQVPDSRVEVLPGSHFLPVEYPDELALLLSELAARTDLRH